MNVCTVRGEFMREFEIRLTCVQDVLDFVSLATSRAFPVMVGNSHHQVNGKSFMEMFCLNFHFPLIATLECTEEEFLQFKQDAARFVAK